MKIFVNDENIYDSENEDWQTARNFLYEWLAKRITDDQIEAEVHYDKNGVYQKEIIIDRNGIPYFIRMEATPKS